MIAVFAVMASSIAISAAIMLAHRWVFAPSVHPNSFVQADLWTGKFRACRMSYEGESFECTAFMPPNSSDEGIYAPNNHRWR